MILTQILISVSFFFLPEHNNGPVEMYVWATKLNVRSEPNINSEITAQLSLGQKIEILEQTRLKYQATGTIFRISYPRDEITGAYNDTIIEEPIPLNGNWVKIIHTGRIGYVFDFYPSRINPIPLYELHLQNELINYLDTQPNFVKKKSNCINCDDDYTVYVDSLQKLTFEIGIKGKCAHLGILIENATLSEGELIGYKFFNRKTSDACGYGVVDNITHIEVVYSCCC